MGLHVIDTLASRLHRMQIVLNVHNLSNDLSIIHVRTVIDPTEAQNPDLTFITANRPM